MPPLAETDVPEPSRGDNPNGSIEVEAKFLVLDRKSARAMILGAAISGLPALGPARLSELTDTYVDSIDQRLRRSGWVARLRTSGTETRLQVKSTSPPDERGVYRRVELDGPALSDRDPANWPPSRAGDRLTELLNGEALIPIVAYRQSRLARDFGTADGSVEVSLDRVQLIGRGGRASHLDLIEVEHRAGDEFAFRHIVDVLSAQPFAAAADATKLGWAIDQMGRPRGG